MTALEIRSGQMKQFQAKAVIIAAGGGGKMFPFTTNGNIKTGDGMAPVSYTHLDVYKRQRGCCMFSTTK